MSKKTNYRKLLDPSIRPQDDFFKHVNSKWIAEHPIPSSEVRWGTFNILRDEAWQAMRDIYESLQAQEDAQGVEQQARDFYHAGMHYDTFEAEHLQLLHSLFAEIDELKTSADLSKMIGKLNAMQLGAPWYTWVDTDHDDSTRHILHICQSGLTLPNRDYYLEQTDRMQTIREAYKTYTLSVFEHFPELASQADRLWEAVISFETALAKVSRSSAELRDIEKNFNKTTFADLSSDYPAAKWDDYAAHLGWNSKGSLSVDQPEFLGFVNKAMTEQPLESWKIYLKWRLLNRCMSKLSEKFSQLHFSFFGKVLSGTSEMMPLWKRVVLVADTAIGEATGKLYAERHFPESSKKQVLSLVEDIRAAYRERIDTLEWMGSDTKQYAKQKLANIKVLIGYPDHWRDFSPLTITRNSHLANVLEAHKFEMAYWLARLDTPTSRDDWFMTPQTVNAYHDPNRLVICFPAAILQAPFFNPAAPLAANMGGIGTVIGHEFTHGFDDQGCQFDAEGNVRQWQTSGEREAFTALAQDIVDQADTFKVLPDLTLKGKLVLGESIADLGGIEIALHAFKAKVGDEIDKIAADSLTAKQLFFINYAFTECGSIREEKLREYTLVDPHPAAEFRVNGMLQHVDDFYSAFELATSDALYREKSQRVKIW